MKLHDLPLHPVNKHSRGCGTDRAPRKNESYFSPSQIHESGIPTVSLPYSMHKLYENFKYTTAPLKSDEKL
jgi:hypothetical protein